MMPPRERSPACRPPAILPSRSAGGHCKVTSGGAFGRGMCHDGRQHHDPQGRHHGNGNAADDQRLGRGFASPAVERRGRSCRPACRRNRVKPESVAPAADGGGVSPGDVSPDGTKPSARTSSRCKSGVRKTASIPRQLRRARLSLVGAVGKHPLHDVDQSRGTSGRSRRAVAAVAASGRPHCRRALGPVKRRLPREQLVERAAQGVNVDECRDSPSPQNTRGPCTRWFPRLGRPPSPLPPHGPPRTSPAPGRAVSPPLPVEHQVRRLHVPMHQLVFVDALQAQRPLHGQLTGVGHRQWTATAPRACPGQTPRRTPSPRAARRRPRGLVGADDRRIIDCSGGLHFPLEAGDRPFVAEKLLPEDLQGDDAIEFRVQGLEDGPDAAFT